jgi:hypothetical protein
MADMIAGEDVSSPNRKHSEVNDLRPADQGEDPSNQPAGKMREDSLRNVLDGHGKIEESFRLLPFAFPLGLPVYQDHSRTTGADRN